MVFSIGKGCIMDATQSKCHVSNGYIMLTWVLWTLVNKGETTQTEALQIALCNAA